MSGFDPSTPVAAGAADSMAEHQSLREQHVVIVGAGIGGLICALLLADRGIRVTLVEAAAEPGGKIRQLVVDGSPIDSGPTVFTMRWVFDEIFAKVGLSTDALLQLQPLQILARHAWRHCDQRLDLFADTAQSADAIGTFSSASEAKAFLRFCTKAREIYAHLEPPYMRSTKPNLLGMVGSLGIGGLGALASLGPLANYWQLLGRYFRDPRLRQLFGRYATYCGASPWAAPATLMLIAHVEQDGVWALTGGMHALPKALAGQILSRGGTIRYRTRCERILFRHGRTTGVLLEGGEILDADAVVFNGDTSALAQGLLGEAVRRSVPPTGRDRRSLSALTWSVKTTTSGFPLTRHNVFFDADYGSEFDDIFRQRRLPGKGTVYVCAQDRTDDAPLAAGRERLLCLVNAPADGDIKPFNPMEVGPCEEQSLKLLHQCGLNIDLTTAQCIRTTPSDFNRIFPGTGGALYGRASHGWMTPFRRQGASSRLPGLYLAGGSVHPGPGVPMAAISGRLAAETVMADLDLTSKSNLGRTFGGISTPSVTMASTR